jgi:hypothetical protein
VLAQQGQRGSEAPVNQKPVHLTDDPASQPVARVSKQSEQELINQKNAQIRSWLSQRLDLEYPNGISLEQYLKAIKKATTSKDYSGIPIYVNPRGLQDSQIMMTHNVFVAKG